MSVSFANLPLRHKLTWLVVLSAGSALLLAAIITAATQIRAQRRATVAHLSAVTSLIAANSSASITFGDPLSANQMLETLRDAPDMTHAVIFDANQHALASYRTAGHSHVMDGGEGADKWLPVALASKQPVSRFSGFSSYETVRPVVLDGEVIGHVYAEADLRQLRSLLLGQIAVLLLTSVLGLVAACLMAGRLQRRVTAPLASLLTLMQRVSLERDYSARAPIPSTDELGALARSFNSMIARVEQHEQELEHNRQSLEALVAERTSSLECANAQLRSVVTQNVEARDAAEAASYSKSQMLERMSHEIRTPMTGVLGMTELLLGTTLDERQRQFSETIRNSAESLLQIINDIFDYSKIESGNLKLETEALDLRAVIEETVEQFAQRARDKGLDLIQDFETGASTAVRGDALRLRQILGNLLANAVHFTSRGTVVVRVRCIRADERAPRFRVEVHDSGIGLRPDSLREIFSSDSPDLVARARRAGGPGLGLVICKRLTELMGGELSVRSEMGRGSCFSIEIPFAAGVAGDTASCDLPMLHLGRRALVIAENPLLREVLLTQLGALGFDVVCAEGAAADSPRAEDFDVVLLEAAHDVSIASDLQPPIRLNKPVRQSLLRTALARSFAIESVTVLAATASARTESLVDESVLQTIGALDPGASSGLIRRIVSLYGEDSLKQLQALNDAVAAKNLDAVARIASALKSSSAHVGAPGIANLCSQMETAAQASNSAAVVALCGQLQACHAATVAALMSMQAAVAA